MAFTYTHSPGVTNKLLSDATIRFNNNEIIVRALWDTGATRTCISKDVVSSLGLTPVGKQQIHTPSGVSTANTYQLDILLPNNVMALNIVVFDSEIGTQGIGALIGMDIINQGDFAVSNYNGTTVFTFRIPSQKRTDYVVEARLQKAIGPIHGKGKRKKK